MKPINIKQSFNLINSIKLHKAFIKDNYNVTPQQYRILLYLNSYASNLPNLKTMCLDTKLEHKYMKAILNELQNLHLIINQSKSLDYPIYITTSKASYMIKDGLNYLNQLLEAL